MKNVMYHNNFRQYNKLETTIEDKKQSHYAKQIFHCRTKKNRYSNA